MNYLEKLESLKRRRSLTQEIKNQYVFDSSISNSLNERFLGIAESPEIKYALGAMQAVASRYTEICFDEGDRVATSLKAGLERSGIKASHDYQGSVPLDIHIKGVSDVDVLILHSYFSYETPSVEHLGYIPATDGKSMLQRIRELRFTSESVLEATYPKASIDISKSKAINLKGGSLKREIDIVPAYWHNSRIYQISGLKKDREVNIYDKRDDCTVANHPFMHMSKINDMNDLYSGNLKRVIRLLKNIKEDSDEQSKSVMNDLSSYDIASLAYNMNSELSCPRYYELGLILKARDYFLKISANRCAKGKVLITPDGSRRVVDSVEKENALIFLAYELNSLYSSIVKSLRNANTESEARAMMKNKVVAV
jgi:hypothetical protein